MFFGKNKYRFSLLVFFVASMIIVYRVFFFDVEEMLISKTYNSFGKNRGYVTFEEFVAAGIKVRRGGRSYNVYYTIADNKNDDKGRVERVTYIMWPLGFVRKRLTMTEGPWIKFDENGKLINTKREIIKNGK